MDIVNRNFIFVQRNSSHTSRKYIRAYKNSEKAGDVNYTTLGVNSDRCSTTNCRLNNYKYNNTVAFNYLEEKLFAMKMSEWEFD
jgi:hypothetical protein